MRAEMNNLIYVKYDTDHFTRISQEGELYALNRDQLELITSILEDKNIPYYTSKVEFCTKIKWDKNLRLGHFSVCPNRCLYISASAK